MPAVLAAPFVLFVWPIPAWTMLLGLAVTAVRDPGDRPPGGSTRGSIALTTGLAVSGAAVLAAEIFVTATGEDFAFLGATRSSRRWSPVSLSTGLA